MAICTIINKKSLLSVNHMDKTLFEIDTNGDISFILNGELKKVESDKDISLAFALTISSLLGIESENIDEILIKLITSYREKQINKLL